MPRRSPPQTQGADTVSALERGIALLRCFEADNAPLGNADLAERTGIPRPSVSRLAATLVAAGLLQQDPLTERFRLGAAVMNLSRAYLASFDIRAVARPRMQRLADAAHGTVQLGVRSGLEMVVIEACRPTTTMVVTRIDVGSRVPLATSALGRAYLSACSGTEADALQAQLAQMHGADWPSLRARIDAERAEARLTGCCRSSGELYPDIHSLATALRTPDGGLVALNVGGPAGVFGEASHRARVMPMLLAAVGEIASETGGSVPLAPAT